MYALLITVLLCVTAHGTLAQSLSASDCGRTFGCAKSSSDCTSSDDCSFLVKYQVTPSDVVKVEMSAKGPQWLALGFNQEVPRLMIGALGVVCKHVNSSVFIEAFNATKHNTPMFSTTTDAGVITAGATLDNGVVTCKFQFPRAGNSHLHDLTVPEKRVAVVAWGMTVDNPTGTIIYHGRGNYYTQVLNVTDTKIFYPTSGAFKTGMQPAIIAMTIIGVLFMLK